MHTCKNVDSMQQNTVFFVDLKIKKSTINISDMIFEILFIILGYI